MPTLQAMAFPRLQTHRLPLHRGIAQHAEALLRQCDLEQRAVARARVRLARRGGSVAGLRVAAALEVGGFLASERRCRRAPRPVLGRDRRPVRGRAELTERG